MKILLLPDKPNWAYSSICDALCKYNQRESIALSVKHIKGNEDKIKKIYKKYDKIFVLGWQNYERIKFLPKKITMVGIHGHHAWDKRKTRPDKDVAPPRKLVDFLESFHSVNVVSMKLYKIFKKAGLGKLYYTANGVDSKVFTPAKRDGKKFVVGYSGSKSHDWRKGVSKFIEPASKKAGAKLKIAMLSTGSYIPLNKMPSFYRCLDAYVCASSSEGFSLSVLEAASCGIPIISTRVGGCEDLIRDGHNGYLVDRNVEDIANRLKILRSDVNIRKTLGKNMRRTVEDDFCWSKKSKAWIEFIENS